MKNLINIGLVALMMVNISCEDKWFQEVDPLKDVAEDRELKGRDGLPFLVKGVLVKQMHVHAGLASSSDLVSDQIEFSQNVQNATFTSYDQLDGRGRVDVADDGSTYDDNYSCVGAYEGVGQFRKHADLLIETVSVLEVSEATSDDTSAYYTGYLCGGMARAWYATYFALTDDGEPGSPIDDSPMIYDGDMFADARSKYSAALPYANDAQTRLLHSLMGKTYLLEENYTDAASHLEQGMTVGDAPYQTLYAPEYTNDYYQQMGVGRTQGIVAYRFLDYITADPLEANRLPMTEAPTTGDQRHVQTKYDEGSDPVDVMSWQENHLMLAEVSLRGATVTVSALDAVNTVRTPYGLSALDNVDLDVLYDERDKELWCTGNRASDQTRWNRWHTTSNIATDMEETIYGNWQYLSISLFEKNNNPNL